MKNPYVMGSSVDISALSAPLRAWLEYRCEVGEPYARMSTRELYEAWCDHCKTKAWHPLSARKMKETLQRAGFPYVRDRFGVKVCHLKWRSSPNRPSPNLARACEK